MESRFFRDRQCITRSDLVRYRKLPRCSVEECRRAAIAFPDWDVHRPIQKFLPPANMCIGHGEVWVVGQVMANGEPGDCEEVRNALQYACEGFEFDAAVLERCGTPHCLYRIWGECGELLYIGETSDITRRLREHSKRQPWWHEVRGHTHEPFQNEAEALKAELHAIRTENPRYNIAGRAA